MSQSHHFFAVMGRLKLIQRWGLMRSQVRENVAEHSLQVAQIAHCIALRKVQLGETGIDPARCALLALYHDAPEVLTGDLPTPIKYANRDITSAYRKVEETATQQLLAMLPDSLQAEFASILGRIPEPADVMQVVKMADTVCALLKAQEELAAGNREFREAHKTLQRRIAAYHDAAVNWFMDNFSASFSLCLDELHTTDRHDGETHAD